MKNFSIAIDGPAGAGKSTIAKLIADQLDFVYVDTGAMYRAFAYFCIKNNIDYKDSSIIEPILKDVHISIEYYEGEQQIILNNRNVTEHLRTNEVSHVASNISTYKAVRLKLVNLQKEIATRYNVVMDGRDIGTFVLPEATLKIFLTANTDVRANRRWKELKDKGMETDLELLKQEIMNRDERDSNRLFAPLIKAEDAIELDTSSMTIEQVIERITSDFNRKKLGERL